MTAFTWSFDPVMTSIRSASEVTAATTVRGPSTCARQGPAKARAVMRAAMPRIVTITDNIGTGRVHHGTSWARKVEMAIAPLSTATSWTALSSLEALARTTPASAPVPAPVPAPVSAVASGPMEVPAPASALAARSEGVPALAARLEGVPVPAFALMPEPAPASVLRPAPSPALAPASMSAPVPAAGPVPIPMLVPVLAAASVLGASERRRRRRRARAAKA
ncbi:hypothetical protein BKM31_44965 [[Actinomadura] parvosata subsp. kistnae]|uniref:Uncharacterized protein n=1 Tax=[Actinomadura] parvosata subsp. kistnae TaxID=1909395 RepID=A0A1V0ABT7_9ACTN|nr:hypothetical protein BKM31_44965 [Nonomuraea sp. ATCC 55076]